MSVCLLALSLVLDVPGGAKASSPVAPPAGAAPSACERDLRQVRREAAELGRGLLRPRARAGWSSADPDRETGKALEPTVRGTLSDPLAQKALHWECRGHRCRATLSVAAEDRAQLDDLTAEELRVALGPRLKSAVENLRPLYPDQSTSDPPRRIAKTIHLVLARPGKEAPADCAARLAARRARLAELEALARTTPRARALFSAGKDNPALTEKVRAQIAQLFPSGPPLPVLCRDRLCRVEAPAQATAHRGLGFLRQVRLDPTFRSRPMAFQGSSLYILMEEPPSPPPERSPKPR